MREAFPKEVLDYLAQMPTYSGVMWHQSKKPLLILKLPPTADFSSLYVLPSPLRISERFPSTLYFSLQIERRLFSTINCVINPMNLHNNAIPRMLCHVNEIDVYVVTPALGFQGIQPIPWSRRKKKQIQALLPLVTREATESITHWSLPPIPETSIHPLHLQYRKMVHYPKPLHHQKDVDFTSSGKYIEMILAYSRILHFKKSQSEHFLQLLGKGSKPIIDLPDHPFWIECRLPQMDYFRGMTHIGMFCFRSDYQEHTMALREPKEIFYKNPSSLCEWRFDLIDERGMRFLRLIADPSGDVIVDPQQVCPTNTCKTIFSKLRDKCPTCQQEITFWLRAINAFIAVGLKSPVFVAEKTKPKTSIPPIQKQQPPAQPPKTTQLPTRSEPVVVASPLLIDRYIKAQQTAQQRELLELSNKYLWMHSAWVMAEALRHSADNEPLYVSPDPLYIELEQPRKLHNQEVFAFSFLWQQENQWKFSVLNGEGETVWSMFYESNDWTLPQHYACPEQKCTSEVVGGVIVYNLCNTCQERMTHYTSWLNIALRMIAGDFQEQVELRVPEEVLEAGTKIVRDDRTGESKDVLVLRKFRLIRYYDACRHIGKVILGRRGSWMAGRPLADSEYEVNLDAIIYVQIQSRDHDRTYRSSRYVNMRGKTQHIDPHTRLQPMTIATYRQLRQIQRITRVFASKFG